MNDQLQKVLADLAAKLGTSVGHLWKVMIYQARVEVFEDLFYYLFVTAFGIVLFRLHVKFSKEMDRDKYGISNYYEENEPSGYIMGILCGVWVIMFLVCFFNIGSTITAACNPEYWALKQILNYHH